MNNNRYLKGAKHAIFFVLVLISFYGCASNPITVESLRIESPLASPIPLKIGLYIPNHFRNYVKFEYKLGGANRLAIGDALTRGAEQALKSSFRDVIIIAASGFSVVTPKMLWSEV